MDTVTKAVESLNLDGFFGKFGFELAMIALVFCVVMAFFAMRLYKIFMSLFGAVGVGFITYSLIGPDAIFAGKLPEISLFDLASGITLAAAILGFIIGVVTPKFVLFLGGIGIGSVFTKVVIALVVPGFSLDPTVTLIIGVIVGIMLGVMLSLLFRPVYILLTSLGCMTIAGIVLVTFVAPNLGVIPGALGGLGVGIIPMIYQFRSSAFDF